MGAKAESDAIVIIRRLQAPSPRRASGTPGDCSWTCPPPHLLGRGLGREERLLPGARPQAHEHREPLGAEDLAKSPFLEGAMCLVHTVKKHWGPRVVRGWGGPSPAAPQAC